MHLFTVLIQPMQLCVRKTLGIKVSNIIKCCQCLCLAWLRKTPAQLWKVLEDQRESGPGHLSGMEHNRVCFVSSIQLSPLHRFLLKCCTGSCGTGVGVWGTCDVRAQANSGRPALSRCSAGLACLPPSISVPEGETPIASVFVQALFLPEKRAPENCVF